MRAIVRSSTAAVCGAVLAVSAVVGCSSDKKSSGGDDKTYVAGYCAADVAATADAAKVEPAGDPTAEDFKKLGPVFAKYADVLAKLDPPADVRAYHESLVKEVRAAAASLSSGGAASDVFAKLEQMKFPTEAGKRLQAIADKNADCTKADTRFDK